MTSEWPAGVLGRGVHHHVGPEGERLLEVRRGEGVVHHQQRPGVVGDGGERGDVTDVEQRVGGRLDPDDLRARGDRRCRRGGVVHGGGRVLQAPARGDLVDQPVGAAVRVVGDDDVVAGHAHRVQQGVLRGQPGGEGEASFALLQGGQVALERRAGRVGRAAVLVATAQPPDTVLLVGRGGVDGRDHRTRHRVGLVARMDRAGLETSLVRVLLRHTARLRDRHRACSLTGHATRPHRCAPARPTAGAGGRPRPRRRRRPGGPGPGHRCASAGAGPLHAVRRAGVCRRQTHSASTTSSPRWRTG